MAHSTRSSDSAKTVWAVPFIGGSEIYDRQTNAGEQIAVAHAARSVTGVCEEKKLMGAGDHWAATFSATGQNRYNQPVANPAITDEQFWDLIDRARGGSSASAVPERLRAVLEPLGDEEILDFGHMLYEKLCDLNHWPVWAAGYVINGGLSDDGFHYFRTWIVGKGRSAFEMALQDPDGLGAFVDEEETENELLEYVPMEILEGRGVSEDPRERADRMADDEPAGEPFEEDTVSSQFPRLAAQFE